MAKLEGGAQNADAYQAKYMGQGALYHDKIRAPLGYHLLLLLPFLTTLGGTLLAHAPLVVPLVTSVFLVLMWALFSVLRISVSKDEVYVQYGLFGPRIPVRDIVECQAVEYDWKKYGGWGIRYGRDGSIAYNMLGDGGRAVKIVHRKGAKTQTVLVASRDPDRLAAAIQEARAAATGSPVKARIEVPEDEAAREAAAEVEALAAEGQRTIDSERATKS